MPGQIVVSRLGEDGPLPGPRNGNGWQAAACAKGRAQSAQIFSAVRWSKGIPLFLLCNERGQKEADGSSAFRANGRYSQPMRCTVQWRLKTTNFKNTAGASSAQRLPRPGFPFRARHRAPASLP